MKQQNIAVIGLGHFGKAVAVELSRLGYYVLAIDADEKRVSEVADQVGHSLILDATDEAALLEAGLKDFGTVIIAIGANIQASILCAVLLKEIGVKKIIAKIVDYYHGRVLEKIGVDRIISPEQEMGVRLARSIANPTMLDYIELHPGYSIVEVVATGDLVGKTLSELDLRRRAGVNVLAIKTGDKINAVPKGDDMIKKGDIIIVSGNDRDLEKLKQ